MAEQRYQAVLAVISDGETVTDVAARFGVSRKTVHAWLAKYEAGGLEDLADGSHRPRSCPHQIGAGGRGRDRGDAASRIRRGVRGGWSSSWPSRTSSGAVGVGGLPGAGAVEPDRPGWRGGGGIGSGSGGSAAAPMELWQMDVVGGFVLADGTRAKALTGVDDHSRFCVSAFLMVRESSQRVCEGLALALRDHGVPEQILTDNGKVFTGRFNQPPVEVLFDRICRENGIEHLLTKPRSPTTTGKVERFHRAIRTEFRTDRVFASLAAAQAELDEWVARLQPPTDPTRRWTWPPRLSGSCASPTPRRSPSCAPHRARRPDRPRRDGTWVARRASAVGVVCVNWQQVCLGCRRRRPQHRRVGHRPGPAVLRRRPPAAHREAQQHRRRSESNEPRSPGGQALE